MKKLYTIVLLLPICLVAYSQDHNTSSGIDTTINLNLLRAPSSPASNLLGIASNEIQRPTDVKAFMLSIQNASQGFSAIPSSFSVDIAPYWFAKKNYSFSNQTRDRNQILQSLVASFAVRNFENRAKVDSTTQIGLGLRFSLLRGSYDIDGIRALAGNISDFGSALDAREQSDKTYQQLVAERDKLAQELADEIRANGESAKTVGLAKEIAAKESALSDRVKELIDVVLKESEQIKAFVEKQRIVRIGWKLDVAGGIAFDFPETKFDNAKILKGGLWITGGYEWKSGHSFFGILRYLNNPDKVLADDKGGLEGKSINTYDGGLRYNFQASGSAFSVNTEFIYRGVSSKVLDDSFRAVVNANYDVGRNTILTLSLGRDFDKTFKKDGSVIAFLNFIKGFGL
jgi:hypothetical protein